MRRGFLSSYTGMLILINVAVFFFSLIMLSFYGQRFFDLFALTPNLFFSGYVWTAFTSMFLHSPSGLLSVHLLANMVSLYFVGTFVEQLIGRKRFLGVYLASGIFASIFFAVLSFYFGSSLLGAKLFGAPSVIALGASGAIFGLVGLIAILTPRNKIYLIAGPLLAIIIQSISGAVISDNTILSILDFVVLAYFIFAIYTFISFNKNLTKYALPLEMPFYILPIVAIVPLVILGLFIDLPIGNSAHLGGLIFGLAYGYYLRKKYPRKAKMIRSYFSR